MILTAKELLEMQKHPSVDEIKHAISGNFCRCTGYTKIVEAIQAAAIQNPPAPFTKGGD
jgi:carbon-monoxide dehydrogenase small subunit